MIDHVLISSERIKYFISHEEKKNVYSLMLKKEKWAIVQGDIVPIVIPPSIMKFERWLENENKYLALKNKKLCKRCVKLLDMEQRCDCAPKKVALPEKTDGPPVTAETLRRVREVGKRFREKFFPDVNETAK